MAVLFSDVTLPLKQRFTYRGEKQGELNVISQAGVEVIDEYLRVELKRVSLPLYWSYRWMDRQGEYQGSFPKRVEQWLWRNWHQPLPPHHKSAIGNLAKQHLNRLDIVDYDFVDHITWKPGDFGELPNNCLWPGNPSPNHPDSRKFVDNHPNLLFMRIFEHESNPPRNRSSGLGRAIVFLWQPPKQADASYLVFNTHGMAAGNDMAAAILRSFLGQGWQFKTVDIQSPHMDVNSNKGRHVYNPLYHVDRPDRFSIE